MKNLDLYILEKLHLNKDTEERTCDHKYKKGDICLAIFNVCGFHDIKECIVLNIIKIIDIDYKNKKMCSVGYDPRNEKKFKDSDYFESYINKYEYLHIPKDTLDFIVIPTNEVINFLKMFKKKKYFDFESYVGGHGKLLVVSGAKPGEEITDEYIDKYKSWFYEATK